MKEVELYEQQMNSSAQTDNDNYDSSNKYDEEEITEDLESGAN
tara:strand:+ start:105 stop:233 length:129 start_codon:yes stop_codon:yes gene_type:complete